MTGKSHRCGISIAGPRLASWLRCALFAELLAVGCAESTQPLDVPDEPSVVLSPGQVDDPAILKDDAAKNTAVIPRSSENPVAVLMKAPGEALRAGETFQLAVILDVRPIYEIHDLHAAPPAVATRLELELPVGLVALDEWSSPELVRSANPDGHAVYVGESTFTRKVRIEDQVPPGKHRLDCSIRFQACNATQCLRPTEVKLQVAVVVQP